MASSSRATPIPDSEVSAAKTRHSRVKSSITHRMGNRRPSASVSDAESRDHAGSPPPAKHGRAHPDGSLAAAAAAHLQALLAIQAAQLLMVDRQAFARQQQAEPSIAKSPPLARQRSQPGTDGLVTCATAPVSDARPVRPNQRATSSDPDCCCAGVEPRSMALLPCRILQATGGGHFEGWCPACAPMCAVAKGPFAVRPRAVESVLWKVEVSARKCPASRQDRARHGEPRE